MAHSRGETSGLIERKSCGCKYGHKTRHARTPNRVDVWECATNHVKRGTCATPHIYQEVLQCKLVEAFQVLAQHHSKLRKIVVRMLAVTGCQVSSKLLHARMRHYETSAEASLFLPDFLTIVEGGMVLTSNQLGFVFTTGEAVTLDLPKGWTPVLRRRAFSYAMH